MLLSCFIYRMNAHKNVKSCDICDNIQTKNIRQTFFFKYYIFLNMFYSVLNSTKRVSEFFILIKSFMGHSSIL